MDKHQNQDELFTPDTVDEQLIQLSQQQPITETNARIVQELQALYEEDNDILERVRERFVSSVAEARTTPIVIQQYQSGRFHSSMERQSDHALSKSTSMRPFSLLVAGLVATFIVGSMIAVFALVRHSDNRGTQVATSQQQVPSGLYIGSGDRVYRIDHKSGKTIWQYRLQDDDPHAKFGSHPPRVVILNVGPDNMVYAISESTVYAIDATRGTLHWSHTLFKLVLFASKPIVSDNRLYVTVNDSVYALNTADGHLLATYNVGAKAPLGKLTPHAWGGGVVYNVGNREAVVKDLIQATVQGNTLYITWNATLYALSLPDGKQLWHRQVDQGQQLSTPHVVDGRIYVSSESNTGSVVADYIYAFDARTGENIWTSNKITDGWVYDITVDHGVIYGSVVEQRVVAYDAKTGKALWSKDVNLAGIVAPQVDGGTVYITSFSDTSASNNKSIPYVGFPMMIVALSAGGDHRVQWTYRGDLQGKSGILITVQDGIIYVNEQNSGTYALNTNGRAIIWRNQSGANATIGTATIYTVVAVP